MAATAPAQCPCDSGKPYPQCCGHFHAGAVPATATELMRSRYSAYVLGLETYLRQSWHPSSCPADLSLDETPMRRWLGLTIRRSDEQDATHATVEFIARFKINGRAYRLHETSRFVREDGRWWYLDGDIHAA